MRVTLKMIERQVDRLNEITGSPPTPWTRTENKFTANIGNFHTYQAYGGVCIHRMSNAGGGVTTPIWHGCEPKREAMNQLVAFINGIEYGG